MRRRGAGVTRNPRATTGFLTGAGGRDKLLQRTITNKMHNTLTIDLLCSVLNSR